MKEVIILGGGLSGLSAAYELSKNGIKVRIIEKSSEVGGLVKSFRMGKKWFDTYYRHIFTSNKIFFKLIKELELTDRLIWKKPKMGVYYNGKIYSLDVLNLVFDFKPLSIIDKFRFGWMTFRVLIKNNWKDLDSITAKEWIIRNAGKNTYKILFEPILKEKWGKYYDKISAAWFWGRLKPRAQSRTSGFISEKLGYMEGSFKIFTDALVKFIKKNGGIIEINSEVKKIVVRNECVAGVEYIKNNRIKKIECDTVVNTLPIPIFLKVIDNLDLKFRERLEKIKYQSIVCATISLKKNLSDVYWMNVCSDAPFGGIIEHTNFIDKSNYGGENIICLFNYLDVKSKKWKLTNEQLIKEYTHGLEKFFPDFSRDDIKWFRVFRDVYATPIYETNYSKIMPDVKIPVKGLYFAGVFKTYPLNRNMDTALKSGIETAREIINS